MVYNKNRSGNVPAHSPLAFLPWTNPRISPPSKDDITDASGFQTVHELVNALSLRN